LSFLLDTGVAIHLRDKTGLLGLLGALGERPALSAVSRVELENGVYRDPKWASARRARLDAMLERMATLELGEAEIAAYRAIVAAAGASRRKTFGRMVAATALVHGLTLVTLNGADFADVPGLDLEVWQVP
jgi:predicted nucleic acid-binding protein